MDKEILLKRYIEIDSNAHSKKIKQQLIKELIESLKTNTNFTFEDIEYISTKLLKTNTTIHLDFFSTILYPIIKKEIELESILAIKLLLQFNQSFVQHIDNEHSSYDLIKKGLAIDPNDISLLGIFQKKAANYIHYSIHEIPAGVLYDNNGATVEQCDELEKYLEEYKDACSKLNIDESDLTNKASYYYTNYKQYLLNKNNFEDFEHYLRDTWVKSKE